MTRRCPVCGTLVPVATQHRLLSCPGCSRRLRWGIRQTPPGPPPTSASSSPPEAEGQAPPPPPPQAGWDQGVLFETDGACGPAEHRALAGHVTSLRLALAATQEDVRALSSELQRLRDDVQTLTGNRDLPGRRVAEPERSGRHARAYDEEDVEALLRRTVRRD